MHVFSVSGPPDRAATAFRPLTWAWSGAEGAGQGVRQPGRVALGRPALGEHQPLVGVDREVPPTPAFLLRMSLAKRRARRP
jgi:hypothetical protein